MAAASWHAAAAYAINKASLLSYQEQPQSCVTSLQNVVLIEILHENENVIGKWREGSCDYASAAAVECVDYACLLRACHFYSIAAASGGLRQC